MTTTDASKVPFTIGFDQDTKRWQVRDSASVVVKDDFETEAAARTWSVEHMSTHDSQGASVALGRHRTLD